MNYTSIDELKNAWIFKHKSLPISDSDKTKIKPMASNRAKVLWDGVISKQVDHPDLFKKGDGAILVGKKRNEAVQFLSTGYFKIGQKPS